MSGPFGSSQFFGAEAGAAAGYVPNGAIWFDGAADYLAFTPGSTTGNKKFTFSCWFKLSQTGVADNGSILDAWTDNTNRSNVTIQDTGKVDFLSDVTTRDLDLNTTQQLRDPTAWMHFVLVVDTTVATPGSGSIGLFLNGEKVTAFGDEEYPAQNYVTQFFTSGTEMHVGINNYDNTPIHFFNGYMSEVIMLDSYAGVASDFGTENSDGVWIPKDPTDIVTAQKGTSGCWLDFALSADLGNDVSGNGNDWSLEGNLAATNWSYDRPADSGTTIGNLATYNPIDILGNTLATANVWSLGNTKVAHQGGANESNAILSIATTSGKWYVEWVSGTPSTSFPVFGVCLDNTDTYVSGIKQYAYGTIQQYPGGPAAAYGTTWSNGTIISCALDQDNGAVYFGTDGVWFASATDEEIAAGDDTNAGSTASLWAPLGDGSSLKIGNAIYNSMDLTVRVSEDSWSYAPPDGFLSLCTANLAAPTVTKPSNQFLPMIYEGNSTGQRVGNFIPFTDAYTVEDSARFDTGNSDYLTKTFVGAGNDKICTISFWHKRGSIVNELVFTAGATNEQSWIQIGGSSEAYGVRVYTETGGTAYIDMSSERDIRDTSAWHNYVVEIDTTSAVTAVADKVKIYIDGVRVTVFSDQPVGDRPIYPALDDTVFFGQDVVHNIGASIGPGNYVDGYIAEFVYIDGTAYDASSFGQTDTSTNRWIPKDVSGLTFGTNGFYLDMAMENSLGNDVSGNDNDFTMTNMDNTNGSNQMYDTPTRNYNVMDGTFLGASWGTTLASGLTQGNLKFTRSSGDAVGSAFMGAGSGKWYVEIVMDTVVTSNSNMSFGIVDLNNSIANNNFATGTNSYAYRNYTGTSTSPTTGQKMPRATTVTAGTGYAAGDVLGIAFDLDAGYMWAAKNNTWFDDADGSAGNPTAGTFPLLTGIAPSGPLNPAKWAISLYFNDSHAATFNFGQWRYFDGGATTLDTTADGYFKYTPPTDFLAFQQDNLPENTAGITGLAWIKNRDATDFHIWFDRARGDYNYLRSSRPTSGATDSYAAQVTNTNSVQRFLQQGVQVGNMNEVNTSAESFVLWNWANDGAATPNTDGNIAGGSTVRVNTDTGFSIVTYTGNGAGAKPPGTPTTVGHGLGAIPEFIILKGYDAAAGGWYVQHGSIGATKSLWLDATTLATTWQYWGDVEPTDEVWSMVDNAGMNTLDDDYIAYCWAGVEGYSKFGSYEGNGDADGPYINLGFKPSFFVVKRTDAAGDWLLMDDVRNPYNPVSLRLNANKDADESTVGASNYDFTANGVKLRNDAGSSNNGSGTYVYAAWAENPFGGSGVAQARAR